jgi:hypothetical protein
MGTLEDLHGKEIRINGEVFTVKTSFTDTTAGEETLILVKPIEEEFPDEPRTIQDLGFTSATAVHFSSDELDAALDFIDQNQGHDIAIAMVDPSGLITIHDIVLVGISIKDPKFYRVRIGGDDKRMSIDFLINAFLLAKKFKFTLLGHKAAIKDIKANKANSDDSDIYEDIYKGASKPRTKTQKPNVDQVIKDILKTNTTSENDGNLEKEEFKQIIDSLFKGILNGR